MKMRSFVAWFLFGILGLGPMSMSMCKKDGD
jgi:hypothetical protein